MWRMTPFCAHPVGRRTVLKTGWALAALEIASAFPDPCPWRATCENRDDEPLTGVYEKLAAAEVVGARLAIEKVNHGGGILVDRRSC